MTLTNASSLPTPIELLLRRSVLAMSMLFFVASGFAALVYQSIWSTYLGLLLGHAAYAQALVLSIFMGGMAIGAWFSSRIVLSPARLFIAYAVVEIGIGILGLLFHPEYTLLADISLNSVLAEVSSPSAALVWQMLSATLLVLPQSILLGMTFPLLGAACVQASNSQNSSVLGGLYFANSIGAAFGALWATFVLVPTVGTPGALQFAGVINLVVGALALVFSVWILQGAKPPPTPLKGASPSDSSKPSATLLTVMLWAALVTGATSFVYEIGWVRMLSLALGSTVHSFELMLSAFIFGLALGGLAVRRWRRGDTESLVYAAALAQVAMGIVSLLCLVVYAHSFDYVKWLIAAARPSSEGYSIFLFGSAALSIFTVMPAAFFAGMTLPLMTAAVIKAGHGTDKIGKVYAANTLGAIIGVLLMIHVLVPLLGVRLSFMLAAIVDVFLGVVLLRMYCGEPRRAVYGGALFAAVIALAVAESSGRVEEKVLASGVFRGGYTHIAEGSRVAYFRDGKTATVSVQIDDAKGFRSIATNGKTDAMVQVIPGGPIADDEVTMVTAAALPLASRQKFERAAVIGFGSGLTTHTLLGSSRVGSVDTIEIESAMIEGARAFGKLNERAYKDPRSRIVINDARTFFASGNKQYDLIISEPSNPWVSGVASLFTLEFYDEIRRHLNPNGILVQWIHAYELDDPLLATMFAAFKERFAYVDIYVTNDVDLLLVGRQEASAFPDELDQLNDDGLTSELHARGLTDSQFYAARKIANTDGVRSFIRVFSATPHSDFFPVVSMQAPRTRFMGLSSLLVPALVEPRLPVHQMLHGRRELDLTNLSEATEPTSPNLKIISAHWRAEAVRQSFESGAPNLRLMTRHLEMVQMVAALLELSTTCQEGLGLSIWSESLVNVASLTLPYLSPDKGVALFDSPEWMKCSEVGSEQSAWLQLMVSIAKRDATAMEQLASNIAQSTSTASSNSKSYLVLTAMLAKLKRRDYQGVFDAELALDQEIGRESPLFPLRTYFLAMARVQLEDSKAAK